MPEGPDLGGDRESWDGRSYYGRRQLKPAPFNRAAGRQLRVPGRAVRRGAASGDSARPGTRPRRASRRCGVAGICRCWRRCLAASA